MQKLSVIIPFYEAEDLVKRQIANWQSASSMIRQNVEFILVDDGSPRPIELHQDGLNLRLLRVDSNIPWNQPGARNLGIFNATNPWAILADVDQSIDVRILEDVLNALPELDPSRLFFWNCKNLNKVRGGNEEEQEAHVNSILTYLPVFKIHGLYDEDFSGHYGYDDSFMLKVWAASGGKCALFNVPLCEQLPFRTESLDRDPAHNLGLLNRKVQAGPRNSPGILRFPWHEVQA